MRRSIWLPLLSLSLLAIATLISPVSATLAQVEQGTITGAVTDQAGAAIPGAQATVTHVQTRANSTTQASHEGHYSVPYLPPGQYEVVVEGQGFNVARVVEVKVDVGLIATLNITL